MPRAAARTPLDMWFEVSPIWVTEALHILGFVNPVVTKHEQMHEGHPWQMYMRWSDDADADAAGQRTKP